MYATYKAVIHIHFIIIYYECQDNHNLIHNFSMLLEKPSAINPASIHC